MSKSKQPQAENTSVSLNRHADQFDSAPDEMMDRMQQQYSRDSSAFKALNAELTAVNRELRDKVAELQAVNNDLHNLLGSTVIATIFLDPSLRIRRFTPAARSLFNLTPVDIGRRLVDTGMSKIGDNTLSDDVQAVLLKPTPIEKEVYDGREHYYLRRVTPYRTSDNRIEGAVLTYTDISRMKRTEEQLEAARQAAEAASQVKSEFLANMSHEIRSPLTAVLGYSDLILVETDRKKIADFALTIKQNGQYLLEIVDDVLDLSRAEANKLTLRKERFSPQRLLADLCSVMRMRARDKGTDLSVHAEGETPETIEGDLTRLRQILLNLIGNAVKFTPQGQITVTMRLESNEDGESMLAFEVRDTGIGIAPGDLERMFEPFEQAETSSSRRYQGAGLGLTISKYLTEMLGGTIGVRSELGRGSVFTVRVPTGSLHDIRRVALDPNLLATVQPSKRAGESQHQLNARVLIVDDIEDVRVLLEQILCGAGARVKTAADAEEALQCVAQAEESGEAFDLVLMDIMLPGMDGVEAVSRLRADGFRRPIVALTAAARESDRLRCLQAGCNDYFCKPIEDEHLLAMVDNYTQGIKSLTQPAAGGEVQDGEPVRVLIVEDNHDAGTAMCKLLEAAGYISNYAADAATALRMAQDLIPDVVLLDLTLPDLDGTEVMQILKSQQGFDRTLFIALSGRVQPDEGEQLLAQGFDHFLLKPASLASLKALLPPIPTGQVPAATRN